MMKRILNLRRDPVDARDLKLTAARLAGILPPSLDRRGELPEAWNQGDVGSCFAHAGCACMSQMIRKITSDEITPSRLCLAVTTRKRENTLSQDTGATLRGTIKTMADIGVPPETVYPYDVARYFQMPPPAVLAEAQKWQTLRYYRIPSGRLAPALINQAIAGGYIVMFGAALYDSFCDDNPASTGLIPMPDTAKESALGGHAMTVVGYKPGYKLVRNSWGQEWGIDGHCWMPDAYFANSSLLWDAWVVSASEIGQ